jgi:hypothetical protein
MRFSIIVIGLLGLSLNAQALQGSETRARDERVEYEDQEVRVVRVVLGPHQRIAAREHPDRVVVFLTTDWQGRLPTNPVEWQRASRSAVVNSSDAEFEAIIVELKGSEAEGPLPTSRTYLGVAQIQLINNRRVEVRRMVVGPGATAPNPGCHIHGKPEVFVHLATASVTGVTGGSKPVRVTRGKSRCWPQARNTSSKSPRSRSRTLSIFTRKVTVRYPRRIVSEDAALRQWLPGLARDPLTCGCTGWPRVSP